MPKEVEQEGRERFKTTFNKHRRNFLKLIPASILGMVGGAVIGKHQTENDINIWEQPLPVPDPDSCRFLLISDIHIGDVNDGNRQNNTQSLVTLTSVVSHLKDYPLNRVIQMGDLVTQQKSENQNITNYKKGLQILQQFPVPVTNLLGNHDVWGISPQSFAEISQDFNLDPFFGVEEYDNFQIVWLDVKASEGYPGNLPEERIDWLRNKVIYKDTPTIIFSHYPVLQQDVDGNYYFNGERQKSAFTNGSKVMECIKGLPVFAIISGHMHWVAYSQTGKISMVTVPSFVENILSSNPKEIPGVYSILEVNYPKKFVLKSYFGSICISRIQIPL